MHEHAIVTILSTVKISEPSSPIMLIGSEACPPHPFELSQRGYSSQKFYYIVLCCFK